MKSPFELDAPLIVSIITTNRCNLKCRHCINNAVNCASSKDNLSTKDIQSIIKQIADSGIAFVEFNGGEFFVRDDVDEILDYAISEKLSIDITSNGTLISDEWIEKYKGKINLMRLSLDSYKPGEHDNFRGVSGSFDKTVNTIKKLRSNNYEVTILTTVTKKRMSDFDRFLDFLQNLGVNGLHTCIMMPGGRGENLKDVAMSADDHKLFLEMYRRYKAENNGSLNLLEESPQKCLFDRFPDDVNVKCGAGFTELSILDDGYVLPCSSFITNREHYQIDELNIRKHSILDIYHNAKIMKQCRDVNGLHGKCHECPHLRECGGGCRATALIVENNILASDPLCWYNGKEDSRSNN